MKNKDEINDYIYDLNIRIKHSIQDMNFCQNVINEQNKSIERFKTRIERLNKSKQELESFLGYDNEMPKPTEPHHSKGSLTTLQLVGLMFLGLVIGMLIGYVI